MARYTRTAYTGVRVPGSCFAREGVRSGAAWQDSARLGAAKRGRVRRGWARLGGVRRGRAWITAIILR